MSTQSSPILLGARYLNDVNAQYLGSGGTDTRNAYTGLLGMEVILSAAEASQLTNTAATGYSATTPLLAGTYKLVKVDSTCTITPARGLVAWWDASAALDSFIVTPDAPTAATQMAGIFIGAPTAGYYCWILIQGEGYLLGKASALTQTGAAGQPLSPVTATGAWDNPSASTGGLGTQTLVFYVQATALANGDVLTTYVPGFAFKIVKFDARCAVPVTTGAKAATLNLEIGTTDLTGGVIALSGTYAQGAAQAGTAVTAANTGTNTDSFSIEASSVTAFVEGAFWLIIQIQNVDTVNAMLTGANRVVAFETPVAGSLKRAYVGPLVSSPISGLQ